MNAPKGKGWLEDDPAVVQAQLFSRHFTAMVGAMVRAIPEEIDHSPRLGTVPDQGPTSSCVGQAFATAIYLTAKVAGTPIPRPSAKAIYDFARAEDQPYVKLVDEGSRPIAAIRCLSDRGMVPDDSWPIVFNDDGTSNIDTRPPLDVFADALTARVEDWYRIPAGPGAAALCRRALAKGYFPVFAMPVDESYERWPGEGGVYEGRKGKSLGGHMQALVGYGDGYLRVAGSWGDTWADRGFVDLAAEYFDSGECTDVIVVKVVQPMLAA